MRRNRCVQISCFLLVAACSSSGGDVGEITAGGDFRLDSTDPSDGATIFLNDPIAFDFTQSVDLESANLTTVSFSVLDESGLPNSEFVTGNFELGTKPGDSDPGRRLLFVPRYPSNNDLSNGGFRAGSTYQVQLVGGKEQNGTVIRSQSERGLEQPETMQFTTVDGTQPQQLFRNPRAGGPQRLGMSVDTATSLDKVPLGLFGGPRVAVRLEFDQALNPRDINVPVSFDPDPLVREEANRGRIYLEYKDADFNDPGDIEDYTWIPATVILERNDLNGAEVVLEPVGVLPNNAVVRVIVSQELEDIAGENNLDRVSYDPVFGTFHTAAAYEQQWNAIVEDFRDLRNIDFGAVFPESLAKVGPGYVRAGFDFGGTSTEMDYRPLANEVVLNTSFTQVVPENGLPFTVNGGVFRFDDVTIPQGVTVRGQGPNPMIWQCSGKFTVHGTLTVSGGDGARVDTLRAANVAKAGGIGACGGGNGGEGTPSGSGRDQAGGTGRGPGQVPGTGGRGGVLACDTVCYNNTSPTFYNGSGGGSGGGGGGMATQGDLNWTGLPAGFLQTITPNQTAIPTVTIGTSFQQLYGFGGAGCSGSTTARSAFLVGGVPGDVVFSDSRRDNNFWGSAIDLNRRLRITGELQAPVGGGGGGGGGDTCGPDGQPWFMDFSGGGGGGGGGVIIVQALEEITVTSTGTISADGGNGGGGEQAGNCGNAGGGGGGAGGMIVLMSAKSINIEAHGSPALNRYLYGTPPNAEFAGQDYSFAVSADGGICKVGDFGTGTDVDRKYQASGQPMWDAVRYDSNPVGGVGGMGVVQLMAPPGDNDDNTNTVLDDNIHFIMPNTGEVVQGLRKQQLLGWRGFADETGAYYDDFGVLTSNAEGDIRPAPVLLPSTLQSQSRARSKWIDTGLSQRRAINGPDGLPRGLDASSEAEVGPLFAFTGTDAEGYTKYTVFGVNNVRPDFDTVVEATAIADIQTNARYLGALAFRVELASDVLGNDQRYVQYEAELLNASGGLLQGYGILAHNSNTLWLDPTRGPIQANAVNLRVRAKFFEVRVNGNESLGSTYGPTNETQFPQANVRIGWAFQRDPTPGSTTSERYPVGEGDFVYNTQEPGLLDYLSNGAPRYVMWDVTFDLRYSPGGAAPPIVTPSTPLPELRFLRMPFRF
ncbi:MAG: hypothetical protein ACI89X_002613 [Planctomycetota bacterium]|jgi:hypothetical protein